MSSTNNENESDERTGWNIDVLRADYDPPRQSDIAFFWDAVNCNPNGDPLSGDEPRRDSITGEALVSMFRIKRYLRDQMHDDHRGEPEDILVKRPDQAGRQNPLDRPAAYRLIDDAIAESLGFSALDLKNDDADISISEYLRAFFDSTTDVRAFGAPISIADDDGDDIAAIRSALPRRITGPVQIHWAVSLNATAKLTEGRKITTVFSSGDAEDESGSVEEKEQGTFGEDNRLKYALFGVNATIDENTAPETRFSIDDAAYLDTAFWRAFKNQTLTHSKIGQEPRLYIRVEYSDGSQVGDLKRRFKMINRDHRDDRELRSIDDWYLDAQGFLTVLDHESVRDRIAAVHLTVSEGLDVSIDGEDAGKQSGPEALVEAVEKIIGDRLDAEMRL